MPLASVIIPAHDEASVIGRLLDGLSGLPSTIEVIVVCNGCTDGTAAVARRHGAAVGARVLEIPAASKSAALNVGDQAASAATRLYVDADVQVPWQSVLAVIRGLGLGGPLAARPPIAYDTAGADAVVRAFYRARTRTERLMTALWGAGFYGVGLQGRTRWHDFPTDTPDDYFVAGLFSPAEIAIVDASPVVVSTPRTGLALLRTLRRVYDLPANESRSSASTFGAVVKTGGRSPTRTLDAVVYCLVAIAARIPRRRASTWERDETARGTA